MRFDSLPQFYRSKAWDDCKAQVLSERMRNGVVVCDHCGKPILKSFNPSERNNKMAMVFHHKIYLTMSNVNDGSVSINPNNIAILHWHCHNEVHQRFGFGSHIQERKVWLVTGAPCSGKTSFVKDRVESNDIVLDIDDVWQMVSGLPRYEKPNAVKPIVFAIRDQVKDMIAKGAGTWRNAYVIGSLPSPLDRKREADRYKAHNVEIVTMEATEGECLDRLHRQPNGRDVRAYEGFIKEYFQRFIDDDPNPPD